MDALDVSRWQFGITTVYHFLMVPLTIGLGVLVATLAWMGGQLRSFVTARVLVSDAPLPKAAR